jgi:hypothetical protein
MDALDGNAIAGDLLAHFGAEMTTAAGACEHCGAISQIAELRVYLRAPGAVARCPRCGAVVIVVVTIGEMTNVHLDAFELRGGPAAAR